MNTFGRIVRVSIFGESHGAMVGVTIDGLPHGIKLNADDFTDDLARRRAGAIGTTPRVEGDIPEIATGWFNGYTTGAPLTILFRNENTKSGDYDKLKDVPRPGHSDFVAYHKFDGYNDYRGGGHFSGRLTLGLVAAGVVAKKVIPQVSIEARLIEAGGKTNIDEAIAEAQKQNDSIGGIVECVATGIPIGLGEPFFDSAESVISHLAFSIPAVKGIEFGSGFAASRMKGSEHNDPIIDSKGTTATNNAGGVNGGITNGNPLVFRIAVKPTSSIAKPQQTLNIKSEKIETLMVEGRHDTCIALRVPVVVEAITAIALADMLLIERTRKNR
ncbi:MAG: chorismate synthase [Tenuifilum sp.]|uniref:chorismate synthase n=1 Tax=Tenuifilum sp. TaxID=2760880 RepID=UPI001B47577F|nr:chorismate synthase [Bacteroidales bacterium]HOK61691.1 chorismate synthase [Tenuifilum sp.]MBP9028826.1 chorismate synthase [Bacteroidales bacterium]HOK85695.1 chorismate synthase [Tenuifilum sp.]HON69843.1 chorismate synthase [Tenuifilum sp.]